MSIQIDEEQVTKKRRIGVVGVGHMGAYHAGHYVAHENVELVGVVDIDVDKAKTVAASCNCAYFTDSKELIGKVDAVSIVVPSSAHLEVAEVFLSEGVHVLIEKPLASTVTEAEQIVELADKFNTKLLVGHQERFNSAIMELVGRIDTPKYIEAHREGHFAGRGGDVDVITDLMIHDIDLVLALIKHPVVTVSALGASVVTSHIDIVNARLEFKNGSFANVTASRVSNERVRNFQVYTPSQYLKLDLLKQTIELFPTEIDIHNSGNKVTIKNSIDVKPNQTLKMEINHFVDILENGTPPYVTGEDGLLAVRVVQMIRETVGQN